MPLNSFDVINPALIDQPLDMSQFRDGHAGYPDQLAVLDTRDAIWDVCGDAARSFPQALWIEPKDWADAARDNDKYHTWAMNYVDRYTNQNPTHECTCHSLCANWLTCWNRQRGIIFPDGPKKGFRYPESVNGSLWMSPLSVYAEANPRQWGGANVLQVMEIACKRGLLPDKIQPKEYNFKHTLQGTTGQGNSNQSSGDWVSVSRFPSGWMDTAKLFKPREVILPESWEEAVCLVLRGRAVSVGRDGHAIPWMQYNVQSEAMAYPDSYDVTRFDSLRTVKRAWEGSFSIASITMPDDWEKLAA